MSPEDLFAAHVDRAEKIATALCWRYRVSGALFYQEEARSEARLALWRACRNFDPGRQARARVGRVELQGELLHSMGAVPAQGGGGDVRAVPRREASLRRDSGPTG